jgi:hypothetical protein
MKTMFWLFDTYEAAKAALDKLMEAGFATGNMNIVVREQDAKDSMDLNWEKTNVRVTDSVGEQTLEGLDRLLGGQQPVPVPKVGSVFAAGEMATVLIKTATSSQTGSVGLQQALISLNVPEQRAKRYVEGLKQGHWLFWIRAEDERASEVRSLLNDQ